MLIPEQVRALKPGQWVRLEYSYPPSSEQDYIDGKVLEPRSTVNGHPLIRIEWEDGHTAGYDDNSQLWRRIDYHPDYRPLTEEPISELTMDVYNLLEANGLDKTIIGRVLLLVDEGEQLKRREARHIDTLAGTAT